MIRDDLPTVVRQWLPHRIGLGAAIYTNGLLVGEILPVVLGASVVLPLVAGSWRMSLVAWSVPIAVISGAAWDSSAIPALAFVPIALCAIGLMVVAACMRLRQELR